MTAIDWSRFGRLLVLIDAANIGKATQHAGFKAHYRRLARLFQRQSQLVGLRFYSAEFETTAHHDFIRSMQRFGYHVTSKPVKEIAISGSQTLLKANFDVEIAVNAMEMLDCYDTLVLFSGDSDFAYLIRHLQSKGKQIIVCSMRGSVARELVESADRYLDIHKLGRDIVRKAR